MARGGWVRRGRRAGDGQSPGLGCIHRRRGLSVGRERAFAQVPVVVVLRVLGFALFAEVGGDVADSATLDGDGVPEVLVGCAVQVVLAAELWGDGPGRGFGLSPVGS